MIRKLLYISTVIFIGAFIPYLIGSYGYILSAVVGITAGWFYRDVFK